MTMKILHSVNGLDLAVYVRVTSFDKDEDGYPVIEDLEFEQIEVLFEGKAHIAIDDLEQELLKALEKDSEFISKIYSGTCAEMEETLLKETIDRVESVREMLWERHRGN